MTFIARTTRDLVTVSGPDAASYLQGQLTQDVAELPVEGLTWSFVLSPQGKVDGWGRIRRTGDESFEIDVDPGAGEVWSARLRRFLLRTKAEVDVVGGVPMLAARGLRGDDGVAERLAGGWLPAGWPGTPGADVLGEDVTAGPAVVAEVEAGGVEIEADAFEALRIRAGVPRWGAEIDEDTIPATLGQWAIDVSVSFTKGCYTGQELVARIDSRGGNVPRRLCGIAIDGAAPAPGAEVLVDGNPAGTLTSTAPDTQVGSVGLLYVPRAVDVGEAGVPATVEGLQARIGPLPNPLSDPEREAVEAQRAAWQPFTAKRPRHR